MLAAGTISVQLKGQSVYLFIYYRQKFVSFSFELSVRNLDEMKV